MKNPTYLLLSGLAFVSLAFTSGGVFAQSNHDANSLMTPVVQVAPEPEEFLPPPERMVGQSNEELPPIVRTMLEPPSRETEVTPSGADINSPVTAATATENELEIDQADERIIRLESFFKSSNATARFLRPSESTGPVVSHRLAPVEASFGAMRGENLDRVTLAGVRPNVANPVSPLKPLGEPLAAQQIESRFSPIGDNGSANADINRPSDVIEKPLPPSSGSSPPGVFAFGPGLSPEKSVALLKPLDEPIVSTETPHPFVPLHREAAADALQPSGSGESPPGRISPVVHPSNREVAVPASMDAATNISQAIRLEDPVVQTNSPQPFENMYRTAPIETAVATGDGNLPIAQLCQAAVQATPGTNFNLVQYQSGDTIDPRAPRIIQAHGAIPFPGYGQNGVELSDRQGVLVGPRSNPPQDSSGQALQVVPLPTGAIQDNPVVGVQSAPQQLPVAGGVPSEYHADGVMIGGPGSLESGFNSRGQCAYCGGRGCDQCSEAGLTVADDSSLAAPMGGDTSTIVCSDCGFMTYAQHYIIVDYLRYQRNGDIVFGANFIGLSDFDWSNGGRVTLGYREDAVYGDEISYEGLEGWTAFNSRVDPAGGLFANFTAGGGLPVGSLSTFTNNVLLEQTQTSELHSLEFNRTYWGWDVVKTTLGIRAIAFDDDYQLASENLLGQQGLYSLEITNRMFGPQIGCELFYDIGYRWSFSFVTKIAAYANVHEGQTSIVNDGTLVLNNSDQDTSFAASGELGMYSHFRILPGLRARAGIDFLGLWNVATTSSNFRSVINPNTGLNYNHDDTAHFRGVFVGVEYYW